MANEVRERRWLVLIFSLYFLLAIGFSLLMPIWEAPDEPAHYHLAWRLARKGSYATEELNYEAIQPRAYYYFGAQVIRALDKINPRLSDYYFPREYKYNIRVAERRFDWNEKNYRFLLGVYALRWFNILFGALALWLNWKAFKLIAPDEPALRLAALALAALTPQYLHIMSSVSNDALGTLASTLLFYFAVRVVKEPANWLALSSIIFALVLPLTTKLTVLPVSAALLVAIAGKWFFSFQQKRWLILSGGVILFCAGFLYFFFPETIQTASSEIMWRLFSLRKKGVDADYLKTVSNQIIQTYWGKVGWLAVGLPVWVVNLLTALGLTGMAIHIGWLIKWKTRAPQFNLWVITFMIAFFTILAVARNGLTTGATQGRLLFPAIGAISILMVSGWHDVLPERLRPKISLILMVLMVVLNIVLWVFGVLPVYYQPFLD